MKEKRNIKKIFSSALFTFFAFFIFGAVSVNAETVMVDSKNAFTKEFRNIDSTSDVVVLARDIEIDMTDPPVVQQLFIYKDKTIDLNGYTLTLPDYQLSIVYNTNATVKFIDSSLNKTGKIVGATDSTGAYPLISVYNTNTTNYGKTYLVFDGINIERTAGGRIISTTGSGKINKVSFINCNIINFDSLIDMRATDKVYLENITFTTEHKPFERWLINSSTLTIKDVISEDCEVVKISSDGDIVETYGETTILTNVTTYANNTTLKVRYKDGFTISNVNLKETLGYSSSTGKNITITNRGTSGLKIESVEVSDNAKFIIEEGNKDEIAAGASDNSWIIKARPGVAGGVYTSIITVKGSNGKSYSANVTLEVEEIEDGYKTIYVTSFDELKDAIDGVKYGSDGVIVTDTSIRKVKLGANIIIPDKKILKFNIINDFVLDLNGYTIDGYTYDRTIMLAYGNNNYQDFDSASLTIIDSSSSQSGTINLGRGAIEIQQFNVNDNNKNYKLIIAGGKYYQKYGQEHYFINFANNDTYWKNKKISFDFKINKGYFEFEGVKGKLLLAQSFVENDQNVNLNISFNNVTLKGRSSYLVYANDKGYTYNDITPEGTDLYIFNSAGKQKLIDDKSISAKASVDYKKYKSDPDFSIGYYEGLKISRKQGFEVTAPTFDKVEYGYSSVTPKSILITNIGENGLGIQNVTVSSADGTKFEISTTGSSGIVEPNATDGTWTIYPVEGLNVGTHEAVITVIDANGNHYTTTIKFVVEPKELTGLGISGLNSKIPFSDPINPTFTGIEGLSESDYKITYSQKDGDRYQEIFFKPNNIGSYKVTITITNENYVNMSSSVTFDIVTKKIDPNVQVIVNKTYTGSQIRPDDVYVRYKGYQFNLDEQFTLEYGKNINVGTGTVIIKPISGNNFTWDDKEVTFNIVAKELTDSNVTLEQTSFRHTGSEIKPKPVVKDGEKILELDTDYELSYSNNIKVGTEAQVIVKGIGNYKGTITNTFSIVAKNPQVIKFADSEVNKTYGDSDFTITANHTIGTGTVKYTSSNIDVATVDETTGKVTIKKAGTTIIKATASATTDYAEETATYTLNVEKKELSYTATVDNKVFDNNKNATVSSIEFTGLVGSESLTKDIDYTVTAEFISADVGNNIDVNVTVTLKNTDIAKNYKLTNTNYVTKANITGKAILEAWITVEENTYTYDGTQKKPNIIVKENGIELQKDTDYTVTYGENINAGKGSIKVIGMGNYSGTFNKEFIINKKNINSTIKIEDIPSVTYDGNNHTPDPTVKDGSTTLVKDRDYTVEHRENLTAGTGYVEISEVSSSNYTFDTVPKGFTISKYVIKEADVTLEYTSTVYDGTLKEPTVTVKMGSIEIPSNEYDVTYLDDHKNVGTVEVRIMVKWDSVNFTGTVIKTFEIVDKTLLTISGINNQQVTYTGSPVELVGTLQVSNDIDPNNLTVKWYKEGTEISRPTNVGTYKVVYSYEDDSYIGSLTVDFEITKKESIVPTLNTYKGVVKDKLSSVVLPTGFKWVDSDEEITKGNKEYNATYTTNNDEANYTTKTIQITVYGKSKVNLNTSVNGLGGTISSSKTDILEGTTETITFTPNTGYIISKVEVNGVDKTSTVVNNKLDVVIDDNDLSVVVTYKVIEYTITINGVANATINPSGIIKVNYNSNKTITIKADLGYNLVSVKVNGTEKIGEITNDKLTLENILTDIEIDVVVEKKLYEVIEGANQKYIIKKDNDAKFKINAEYVNFERGGEVYIDGILVDPSNYTSKSGSTIITFKKDYMNTLSLGEHSLKVLFTNGEANTNFVVAKLSNEINPDTSDNALLYILVGIFSTFSLIEVGTYIYKRKQIN